MGLTGAVSGTRQPSTTRGAASAMAESALGTSAIAIEDPIVGAEGMEPPRSEVAQQVSASA